MILKFASHRRARDPLAYALDAKKHPQVIAGNLTSRSVDELSVEIHLFVDASPGVDRPVDHIVLSFAPGDWDKLRDGKMEEMLDRLMAGLGYGNSAWVGIAHHDTNMVHLSIVASGIDATGHRIATNWQGRMGRRVIERLEHEFDLLRTREGSHVRAPSRDEIERDRRLGLTSNKEEIRSRVDAALHDAQAADGRMLTFVRALRERGITPRYYPPNREPVLGISYAWQPAPTQPVVVMSGTQLGRGYTWPALNRERGLSYAPERDRLELLRDPSVPVHHVETTAPHPELTEGIPGAAGEAEPLTITEPVPVADPARDVEPLTRTEAEAVAVNTERRTDAKREGVASEPELTTTASPSVASEPEREFVDATLRPPVAEVEMALERLDAQLRELKELERQQSELERAVSSAALVREQAEGKVRSPRISLLEHFREVYRDSDGAVATLERAVNATDRPIEDLLRLPIHRAPERLGALLPKRRILGDQPPDPERARQRLSGAAPAIQSFIAAVYSTREARRAETALREQLQQVTTRIAAHPRGSVTQLRELMQQIQEIAPKEEVWARWRERFPRAVKTVEREFVRWLQQGERRR